MPLFDERSSRLDNPFANETKLSDRIGLSGKYSRSSREESAALVLFSPYNRDASIIRPFSYSHDNGELMRDVRSYLTRKIDERVSSIGGLTHADMFFDHTTSAMRSLQPSEKYFRYDSATLCDSGWRFVLTIENAPRYGRGISTKLNNRLVYSGFVIGDCPVSTTFGRTTVDERAVFMVTHFLHIDLNRQIGASGDKVTPVVMNDLDVLHPDLYALNDDQQGILRDNMLAPERVLGASVFASGLIDGESDDIISCTSPAAASLTMANTPVVESKILNSPAHQVNRVMSGLISSMQNASSGSLSGRGTVNNGYAESVSDMYARTKTFTDYLRGDRPSNVVGLDLEEREYTFRFLLNKWPSIKNNIQIFDVDIDERQYGYAELEEAPNPTNISCALIKSALPPLLADYGLCDCTFRWASSDPTELLVTRLNQQPVVKIYDLASLYPEDNSQMQRRFNGVLDDLEKHVFAVIESMFGEFEVYVQYNQSTRIIVQIQLREMTDVVNDRIVIGQESLGGIISPLLGDEDDFNSHQSTLASLVQATTLVDTDGLSAINHDDFYV